MPLTKAASKNKKQSCSTIDIKCCNIFFVQTDLPKLSKANCYSSQTLDIVTNLSIDALNICWCDSRNTYI